MPLTGSSWFGSFSSFAVLVSLSGGRAEGRKQQLLESVAEIVKAAAMPAELGGELKT
jgi:hypothetical protein